MIGWGLFVPLWLYYLLLWTPDFPANSTCNTRVNYWDYGVSFVFKRWPQLFFSSHLLLSFTWPYSSVSQPVGCDSVGSHNNTNNLLKSCSIRKFESIKTALERLGSHEHMLPLVSSFPQDSSVFYKMVTLMFFLWCCTSFSVFHLKSKSPFNIFIHPLGNAANPTLNFWFPWGGNLP